MNIRVLLAVILPQPVSIAELLHIDAGHHLPSPPMNLFVPWIKQDIQCVMWNVVGLHKANFLCFSLFLSGLRKHSCSGISSDASIIFSWLTT